jgi:pyruvate-ferredoxin/flavodoxin oxidoreductase
VPDNAPEFVRTVTAEIIAGRGEQLPVSAFPVDGAYPTATTQYEKRNIAVDIPVWERNLYSRNICSLVCPHARFVPKSLRRSILDKVPADFKYTEAKPNSSRVFTTLLQVAPEDCNRLRGLANACPHTKKTNREQDRIQSHQYASLRLRFANASARTGFLHEYPAGPGPEDHEFQYRDGQGFAVRPSAL